MQKLTFLFLVLVYSLLSYSQNEFKPGYIVKLNGDTVKGNLKFDIEENLKEGVLFDEKGVANHLGTDVLNAFAFDGLSIYRKVNYYDPTDSGKWKKYFVKCLFDGTNDLFTFSKRDIRYFILKSADTTCLLYNDLKTNSGELVEKGNFRNQLFFVSRNCEEISNRVELLQYSESSLVDWFKKLEKCVGNYNESQVLYQRPKMTQQIIIYGGGMIIPDKYDFAFQATMRFIFPSESKKTSLNVGIGYGKNYRKKPFYNFLGTEELYDSHLSLISIPVFIQYNILNGKIQPYVYAGTGVAYIYETVLVSNVYTDLKLGSRFGPLIFGGAGIEALISKNWMVKVDFRYDNSPHLPIVGLAYRFIRK